MFEKVSSNAEQIATELPRRAFFGKVAKAALPVAAALGGLLALPGSAQAFRGRSWYCCKDSSGTVVCRTRDQSGCPTGTVAERCDRKSGGIDVCRSVR